MSCDVNSKEDTKKDNVITNMVGRQRYTNIKPTPSMNNVVKGPYFVQRHQLLLVFLSFFQSCTVYELSKDYIPIV